MPGSKPNAKKIPPRPKWLEDILESIDDWFQPLADLPRNWHKLREIAKNNFDLGLYHLRAGHIDDAVFRFRMVTWLDPRQAEAWYYLGCSQMALDNSKGSALRKGLRVKAESAFAKALQLKPDYEEAAYMMAVARGAATPENELPRRVPLSLAQGHFNSIAAGFTEYQLDQLHYQGHVLLTQAIRAALVPGRLDHMILELGVGTGLCGPLMRDVAAQIIGVDISAPMLDEAMQLRDDSDRKIYDALINREMLEFLSQSPEETYDVVMAGGVFSYVGDLQDIFAQVARVLKRGGVFGFTADEMPDTLEGEGFRFAPSVGRFRFSRLYLQKLAFVNKLSEAGFERGAVYPDFPAWICVFRK